MMKKVQVVVGCVIASISQVTSAADRLVPSQYATIQAAIDASMNGDVVQISPGTYAGPINLRGKAITVRGSEVDPSLTVISGGISVVRFWTGETTQCVLEGVTVTGGTSSVDPYEGTCKGAGIHVRDASPTIRNCRILSNRITTADGLGGTVRNAYGAGICVERGSPLISNCLIGANSISTPGSMFGTDGLGAGICLIDSSAVIQDCTITGNVAQVRGGGGGANGAGAAIAAIGTGSPQILRCQITTNVADVSGSYGCTSASAIGAGTTVTIRDCVIRENQGGCSPTGVLFLTPGSSMSGTRICGNSGAQVTGPYLNLGGNGVSATCPQCAGDLNGDGFIDGTDLGTLLSRWGPCTN